MQTEKGQDSYTISQNTFGTYEVLIRFATGEERRQGRFVTEAAARAWIESRRPSVALPRSPTVSQTAVIL
jgi:hypothetical protein